VLVGVLLAAHPTSRCRQEPAEALRCVVELFWQKCSRLPMPGVIRSVLGLIWQPYPTGTPQAREQLPPAGTETVPKGGLALGGCWKFLW